METDPRKIYRAYFRAFKAVYRRWEGTNIAAHALRCMNRVQDAQRKIEEQI